MDILFDSENLDKKLGKNNSKLIERDLDNILNGSLGQEDSGANSNHRENSSQEIETRNIGNENVNHWPDKLLKSMEILSGEVNLRLSQVMDPLLNILQAQISTAINSAIKGRAISGIQNIAGCLPSSENAIGTGT